MWQIFSRSGQCLLYKECSRPAPPRDGEENEKKLLFGYLFSLKQLVLKMSPKKCPSPSRTRARRDL